MPAHIITPSTRWSDRPLYSLLVQFPAVCFTGALVADVTYWRTALYMWETFAVWLIAAGCSVAGLALIVGLVEFVRDRRVRDGRLAWPHAFASVLVLLLSTVNAFVHSRDGYTAVVPEGLTLSAIVVLLMIAIAAMAWWPHDRFLQSGEGVAA